MSITLTDIAGAVAASQDVSRASIERLLVSAFSEIAAHLEKGDDVVIKNFARLQVKDRPGRVACNPLTKNEPVEVPPRRVIKLVPRGDFKDLLGHALDEDGSEAEVAQ